MRWSLHFKQQKYERYVHRSETRHTFDGGDICDHNNHTSKPHIHYTKRRSRTHNEYVPVAHGPRRRHNNNQQITAKYWIRLTGNEQCYTRLRLNIWNKKNEKKNSSAGIWYACVSRSLQQSPSTRRTLSLYDGVSQRAARQGHPRREPVSVFWLENLNFHIEFDF